MGISGVQGLPGKGGGRRGSHMSPKIRQLPMTRPILKKRLNQREGGYIGVKIEYGLFFSNFSSIAGISQQNPGYPAKKRSFPGSRDIPNFSAPPLHVEDPYPTGKYPDSKVWVCALSSCLVICFLRGLSSEAGTTAQEARICCAGRCRSLQLPLSSLPLSQRQGTRKRPCKARILGSVSDMACEPTRLARALKTLTSLNNESSSLFYAFLLAIRNAC